MILLQKISVFRFEKLGNVYVKLIVFSILGCTDEFVLLFFKYGRN